MKKFILLTLATLMVVGCGELPAKAQLDIVNGTEYIITRKSKNVDEYTYCYRLIKFRQDKNFDYGYRDTSNYNVGDTLIFTIKRK